MDLNTGKYPTVTEKQLIWSMFTYEIQIQQIPGDTVNGEGGFARLEYNVSKAISDYYHIHLNYNMIRKNKKSPTLQQSAVFCISPPASSAVIMTMPPIMLIAF